MTSSEALQVIHQALETALEKKVTVTAETDLFADGILDSLDTMIFFLTLEELSGAKFPDKNLEAAGFNKVSRIIEHITAVQA